MQKYFSSLCFSLLAVLLIIVMILYPELIMESSKEGLILWVDSVFTSLFPFLILINIITHLGIIDFIGTLLSPIISPIFGINGIGALPLFAGLTSGYPVGAKLTCQLYTEGKLTKNCASKVICFSNNSGPLFIIGSVGIGMYDNIAVGYFILLVHILSALTLGILINIYTYEKNSFYFTNKHILKKSWNAMRKHLDKNKKTVGEILSESIATSITTILTIGGYIILFSVIIRALEVLNINSLIKMPLFQSLFYGSIEMTNGIHIASDINSKLSVIISCILVSFGGFSIHAQAINFISKTDLSTTKYLFGKILAGLISMLYGFLIYPIFDFSVYEPTFFYQQLIPPSKNYLYFLTIILLLYYLIKKVKPKATKV